MSTLRTIALAMGLVLAVRGAGSAPSAAPAPPAGAASPSAAAPAEPPAPQPSPAVQALLDAASRAAAAHQPDLALQSVEHALATARQVGDPVGEARALRGEALFLEPLGRAAEALSTWQEAAVAWERLGAGPEEAEALAQAGLLLPAEPSAQAGALISQAIARARAETRRPLAAARALSGAVQYALQHGRLGPAGKLGAAVLAIREEREPGSLETADTLTHLGDLARRQGDEAAARDAYQRGILLYQRLNPHARNLAVCLGNLGLLASERGDLPAARAYDEQALALMQELAPGSLDLAISLNNLGTVRDDQGDIAAAAGYFQQALAIREKLAPESPLVAGTLNNLGTLALERGDLPAARTAFERSLTILEKQAPDSLAFAQILSNLGDVASRQSRPAAAREYLRRALALLEKRAPGSRALVSVIGNLGALAAERGDLPAARAQFERALALDEKLSPGSLDVAQDLNNLGAVVNEQGDSVAARGYYRQALAIQQKLAPASLLVAASFDNLGVAAYRQGDLAAARAYLGQALQLQQRLAPSTPEIVKTWINLGQVAHAQGDNPAAVAADLRALAVQEKLAPRSLETAAILNSVGGTLLNQRKLPEARKLFLQALDLRERLAPGSLSVAECLGNLGMVAFVQQEWSAAKPSIERALAIQARLASGSAGTAILLNNLGAVDLGERNLAAARRDLDRALALHERADPQSLQTARTRRNLGLLEARQGHWPAAERHLAAAWALVRRQAAGVSGDEALQGFGSANDFIAAELARAQVAVGQLPAAFETLEESRAYALRQILAERHLDLAAVPTPLRVAYQEAVLDQDRAEPALSRASSAVALAGRALAAAREAKSDPAALTRLQATLTAAQHQLLTAQSAYTEARLAATARWNEIERRLPRAFPPPLSLAQAARALPPGTLFAAFSVGSEQSLLFLLSSTVEGRPALAAFPLSLSAAKLRAQIQAFRVQVTAPDAVPADTTAASRALYASLFPAAARPALRHARRLLLSPDGPLWEVPFAALVTNQHGSPRYLGAGLPLTETHSLTLFAQAVAERPRAARPQPLTALVVGDPLFDRHPVLIASAVRSAAPAPATSGERGLFLLNGTPPPPLPATRKETVEIARLYGAHPLLGGAATEAAVRQEIGQAAIIHLATHGYLDRVRAMSSGLLLAAPEQEPAPGETENDGVLQAWEIYSELRLRAELVVLSACETGQGQNVAGEGIVGLSRALQYAGAQSIVASQWSVADASTAVLMVAFHRRLRAGEAKDEALRSAMLQVARDPRTAAPYYWAPFFLIGDPEGLATDALLP